MAAPSMTQGAFGNIVAAQNVALSATYTSPVLDYTTKFEAQIQASVQWAAGPQAGATATVQVFREVGAGPTADTIPLTQVAITPNGLNQTNASIALPTGKYLLKVVNSDTANAFTLNLTSSTIDAIV